ncbi:MAG: phosphopyruvate hydratase [Thermoplasmata archaeon]|nr:MAG: phosphopyruvate hydratase [Thermoplasmata archaeon]MCD6468193.1 phosphopyruvate hydratase [Thermoplasmata archaeon]RLF27960.1 MAG: phosphopyruvate hydratase [Thermoplasmata archaeon]
MCSIQKIKARQVLDSRGNPTVEVEMKTQKHSAVASVPSGASTGTYEAVELRDNNKAYGGKGVTKAVENINQVIAPKLLGRTTGEQKEVDRIMVELDGTENKNYLGANAILGCSMAYARLSAACENTFLYEYIGKTFGYKPEVLPIPALNVINGGKHAGNSLDIQEHLILPVGAKNFSEALRMGAEVYHVLKKIILKKYGKPAVNVGDEGGYAPPLNETNEAFELIAEAIEEAGYNKEVKPAFDAAASEFYNTGVYTINNKPYTPEELTDFYGELIKTYGIVSAEDPFAEEDWDGFALFTKKFGDKIQIIGDDIFVTNIKRLKKGIEKGVGNCLLLKVNQIGTVTEAINAAELAFKNNYSVMVSHRSGETCDPFIADLVVGINAGQIKSGAPARGERVAKYNRLLQIEETKENWKFGSLKTRLQNQIIE